MSTWLTALGESTAACGGKARGLARLIAAGLPVPEGWVLDDRAFRAAAGALPSGDPDAIGHALAEAAARIEAAELPAELIAEVEARARALGRLAVRSSATIEDGDAGAAAGVFSSRVAVRPDDVWPAIRAVWASALTPLAAGYARRRGGAAAIAVILQRSVDGERATVYTRPPGAPDRDEVWIQRGERIERLPRGAADPIVELALRAERAIGREAGGADVELVLEEAREQAREQAGAQAGAQAREQAGANAREQAGAQAREQTREQAGANARRWIVQARPIVHPARRARPAAPPMITAPLVADGRTWTWDVAHNPDPLSPAQASIVERVERAGAAPWAMRVCAGYLYTAAREVLPPPRVADRDELLARAAELERRIEAALAEGGAPGADPIDRAMERYLAFYAIWAREVVPLIAAARAGATPELRGARPSALEAALIAAARGELDEAALLARFGAMSPAWDVAVPTFGERPGLLRDAIERARLVVLTGASGGATAELGPPAPRPPAPRPPAPAEELARAGADLAERDDLWFARAQWQVRRAVLERAAALGLAPDEAFWLPFESIASLAPSELDDARRRAAAAPPPRDPPPRAPPRGRCRSSSAVRPLPAPRCAGWESAVASPAA